MRWHCLQSLLRGIGHAADDVKAWQEPCQVRMHTTIALVNVATRQVQEVAHFFAVP